MACGKLEFDDAVVAVNVVMASDCTDIDATDVEDCVDDDFWCWAMLKAFDDDSITFATAAAAAIKNKEINIKNFKSLSSEQQWVLTFLAWHVP